MSEPRPSSHQSPLTVSLWPAQSCPAPSLYDMFCLYQDGLMAASPEPKGNPAW